MDNGWKILDTQETLAERLALTRTATQEAERWLAARYLHRLGSEEGATFKAKITHINSSGFHVRLDANGLGGFVDLRKDPEKFSYDKWTASLTSTTRRFSLEQPVELVLKGVDRENRHLVLFQPVAGCGLKPAKPTVEKDAAQNDGAEEAD